MRWHCIFIHQKNGAKTSRVAQIRQIVAVVASLTKGGLDRRTIIDRKVLNIFFMLP
jgi:hypothetical protein